MRLDLLLILFLTLWDGRAGLIRAETPVYEAAEGGNITVQWSFIFGGSKKTFCKNVCNKQEDILVQTSGNSGRKGRYSIKYEGKGLLKKDLMYVSITNVTSSDSGQYQCVLERNIIKTGFYEFIIKVTKDASLNPTYTLKPNASSFTVKTTDDIPSSFTVKTTDDIPSFTSVTTTEQSLTQAPVTSEHSTTTSSPAPSGASLYVALSLVAVLILFAAALLILCWNKRTNKPKQPPVDSVIPEVNRLYEEIPENNVQRTPRPVEVSTVYTTASFNSTNTDGTPDIYSRVSKQRQVASTSSEEHYSDVDFSRSGPSINSAPRSQPDQQLCLLLKAAGATQRGPYTLFPGRLYSSVEFYLISSSGKLIISECETNIIYRHYPVSPTLSAFNAFKEIVIHGRQM